MSTAAAIAGRLKRVSTARTSGRNCSAAPVTNRNCQVKGLKYQTPPSGWVGRFHPHCLAAR